jgi:hypothetical protein
MEKRMSQENSEENFSRNENVSDTRKENLNHEEPMSDSSDGISSEDIDNLPIESIGSYARLEELVTEEEAGNTSNPTSQS